MEHPQDQSSGDSDAVGVDIPSLAQALEQERQRVLHGGSQPASTLTIGMVQELTRNVDAQEYDPQYISIGPYHRRRIPDIRRDDDKLTSLNTILSAAGSRTPGVTVQVYLEKLAAMESRARSCYANSFDDMTSAEFLRMLLLDACYVLHWFGNVVRNNGSPVAINGGGVQLGGHQRQSSSSSTASAAAADGNRLEAIAVVRDVLYLVENQIPYFVVDEIRSLTFSGGSGPAEDAIAGYVSQNNLQYSIPLDVPPPAEDRGNLLHLLHMHFLKPAAVALPSPSTSEPVGRCRSATEYRTHGVDFRSRPVGAGSKEARCILDVTLDGGGTTLVIPRLNIDAETWRILRNLMALEQQNPAVGSHVTAYCVFMSQLACTARDVELLSRRGAMVHRLGNDDEVAKLFSDLCKGIAFNDDDPDRNYLRATRQELEKCYRSRRRRWMALLRQNYFANPWLVVGVMAAAIVLVCGMVQALYAVLAYYSQSQGPAK